MKDLLEALEPGIGSGALGELEELRADSEAGLREVGAERAVVNTHIPLEVERNRRRGAGQPVHLGGVVDLREHRA